MPTSRLLSVLALTGLGALATPALAASYVFTTTMSGAAEFIPNASLGTGNATVTFDDVANTVSVVESWANLSALATANHIHVATTPGGQGGVVLGFASFVNPSPATGNFAATFTLAPAALTSLLTNTKAGLSYVNLHSQAFGGGEIRGFLVAQVPEPETYALLLAGLGLVGLVARRSRR